MALQTTLHYMALHESTWHYMAQHCTTGHHLHPVGPAPHHLPLHGGHEEAGSGDAAAGPLGQLLVTHVGVQVLPGRTVHSTVAWVVMAV